MAVTYSWTMRIWIVILLFPLIASAGEIYTRDGVTDGDTFYLAPGALTNNDPVFQSWVAYSLMKSTCQLKIGGDNPARANSFECEFTARRHLVIHWEEQEGVHRNITNGYLVDLSAVYQAGFLAEYTSHYFGQKDWELPDGLRVDEFRVWRRQNLRGHKPMTRITGSWNYKSEVQRFQ